MKVLVLKNFSTTQPWGQLMMDSFCYHIHTHHPEADINVCDAAGGDDLPGLDAYQLVILTGGTFDLMSTLSPWASNVISFIRQAAQGRVEAKLLGICWGHQAIHYALGGQLGLTEEGPKVGVEDITTTSRGYDFFGSESLALHKFHKRCVKSPAPGFRALGVRNEIYISQSANMVTLQSHPELTYEIARNLIDNDDGSYSGSQVSTMKDIKSCHDGDAVWDRIMKWAAGS